MAKKRPSILRSFFRRLDMMLDPQLPDAVHQRQRTRRQVIEAEPEESDAGDLGLSIQLHPPSEDLERHLR